jgi:hypothetical protein
MSLDEEDRGGAQRRVTEQGTARTHEKKLALGDSNEKRFFRKFSKQIFAMPAPLYARYVPPKVPKTPIQPARSNPEPVKTVAPSSAPQLYARYIPPKAARRTIESPTNATLKDKVTSVDDGATTNISRKRKRPEENYAHEDRRALIDSLPAPEPTSDQPDEIRVESRKDKKDKKDKSRKSRKAEAIETSLEATDAHVQEPQHKDRSPEAADSILAKYSVTGGARRNTLLAQRSHAKPIEQLELEEQDEDGSAEDEMDVDVANENHYNNGVYQNESAEELTPAGVEAIFQKYRRSTQLAAADDSEGIPNANVRRAKEKREREAAEAREREQEQEPELHGWSDVHRVDQPLIPYQVWSLFHSLQLHIKLLIGLLLTRYPPGLRNRQSFPLTLQLLSPIYA